MVKVPDTVMAVDGSCVEVSCQTAPHYRVIWYEYHSISYPKVYDGKDPASVGTNFKGRTSVGNASEGDCTLRMERVTWTDDNLCLYVWINPEVEKQKFYEQKIRIKVTERKAPVLSIQNSVVEGDFFQANCSIIHSCPSTPPSLRLKLLPENFTSMTSLKETGGLWISTKTIQGIAKRQLHNKEIKCTSKFSTVYAESEQLLFNILYAPDGVTVKVQEQPIILGSNVHLECVADSNPPPSRYLWIIRQGGQSFQENSTQSKMVYNNISQDTSFSCIVQNHIGSKQSGWLFLDMNFPPVILSDSSCCLWAGVLHCVCRAEARPNASLHWRINGSTTLPSSFTSSYIITARENLVSAEFTGPVERKLNVSCIATNSLAMENQLLQVDTGVECGQFLQWMLTALAFGCIILFGAVSFICSICCRKRQKARCDRPTLDIPLRSVLDPPLQPSSQQKAKWTKPKEKGKTERQSDIYENDFLPKKPSQTTAKNNKSYPKIKLQKDTEIMLCPDMDDIYQNL
ncbi:sialic acid-binding Ig-like lectin 5 [Esox lucius]|uniref:sialic acid-binding Ig-like lectin 5 n=1 Tax=Esox lucius TaxID=8010 RepID=UPI001476950F|nr:sialic acid-binding Ig-like lectin 5 [Esox lucius]